MKTLKAIELEADDINDFNAPPAERLTPEATKKYLEADLVVHESEVVKNRLGPVTKGMGRWSQITEEAVEAGKADKAEEAEPKKPPQKKGQEDDEKKSKDAA